ncbi:hypothetical protein C2G38_2065274 [Gigaspora rosea]|uniref:Uncharacterized protein n=1 Tax=Gigaspora rosea TaxID=44941 RepID=A0A397VUL6_9GLOM|nr:hypothetical protein C2G38_2065274 [Gigaspora rosea]
MQVEKYRIHGITKNTETGDYMIVLDFYYNERMLSNGTCEHCKRFNTSPAWCQSCDPWKSAQKFTSGNEEIDNFIKEFQTNSTEYDKVIEWIPFDRLVNRKEIKNKSEVEFMADWLDCIRIIEGESGNYTRSRTISRVELMKLHCSQASTLKLIENFKNHVQLDKYRIHGITQDTETGEYMIVFDFYHQKRKPINGICEDCKRYNTYLAWCQLCDPWREVQGWTSNDKDIDDCIKEFQLKATAYENVIEWIHFDRLEGPKQIGKVLYTYQLG